MGIIPGSFARSQGAKDKAKELGVELSVQDVQFDANLAVTTFDTYVGDGVRAIAVVVPDRNLGPVVADKAKQAGVALIAVDDDITFKDGAPVPYVGMNALNIGNQVGGEIARIFKAEGWDKDMANVASPRSRTRRQTPACVATRAQRRHFSRSFPTSPRARSSASLMTIPW